MCQKSERSNFVVFGSAATKFVIVNNILGILTRSVDAMMIYFIISDPKHGVTKAFFYAGTWNFVLCAVTVWINNYVSRVYDYDLTGLGDIRDMKAEDSNPSSFSQFLHKIKDWILSRRYAIFWIGSWFSLDPDFVTILLQKSEDSFLRTMLKITLPSTILAMVVWTGFYWVTLSSTGVARYINSFL